MAVYVQDRLGRVGIRMEIQVLDAGTVLGRLKNGEFEAAFMHFRHSSWWLWQYFGKDSPVGYRNFGVVKLIDRAMLTADPDTLDAIYRELMEMFHADVPVSLLFASVNTFIVHRRIRGLSSPWRTDPVQCMEDLWLEDRSD